MTKFIFGLAVLLYSPGLQAQQNAKPLVLEHVTVIDMTGATPRTNSTVVIERGRITAVGNATSVRVPNNASIIDGNGKFLIPGLWDMHVHFTEAERTFPLFIANGVTGVRNMGGNLEDLVRWRKQVENGELIGPRIVTCGPILDGPEPAAHGPVIVVATPEEARKTVDDLKLRGADCVKVYDRLRRDVYFAIIDEAKKQKIPVVGHVPLSITTVEASEAGQQTVEHLGSILESASTLEAELFKEENSSEPVSDPSQFPKRIAARGERMLDTYDPERARKIFDVLKKNQTWQVPTLEFKWGQTFIDDLSQKDDSRLKYVPEADRQWWSPQKNFFARYRTPEYITFRKRMFRKELDLVGALHRAGVPFMAGTDLSGAYVFPGFSLHHELELYVQAGFTPMEALQSATRNPAIFLDNARDFGTVEKGKIANLVLLDADPLVNIRNTQRINAVVLNGRYISRNDLDQLLSAAANLAAKN